MEILIFTNMIFKTLTMNNLDVVVSLLNRSSPNTNT